MRSEPIARLRTCLTKPCASLSRVKHLNSWLRAFIVDLMASACGIRYAEASQDTVTREVDVVRIPFASPRLLWRMKKYTHRAKDAPDLLFLRQQYGEEIFDGAGPG